MKTATAKTKICIIIGDPVAHSLSPRMHTAAYKALGIDDQYIFIAAQVKSPDLSASIAGIKAMGIHGITCTMPHKTDVMNYLDAIDTAAEKIGAVNTIVNENGILKGYNTDWLGIVTPLKKMTSLKGKKIAVIGAGGAARSAIYGLKQSKADIYVFNRNFERAQQLAQEFGITPKPMSEIRYIKNCDIVINTTPLGMHPYEHISPVPKEYLTSTHIVFDVVYSPYETQLLKDAKTIGARIIHGIEMLLHQGTAQFELYTGKKAPEEEMHEILNSKY